MSDREVKSKKSGRGRGRGKAAASSTITTATKETINNASNSTASGGRKSSTMKKASFNKGLKIGRGRGRIRIEDSSSDEEIIPKIEADNNDTDTIPVQVKAELPLESEEKGSDENNITRITKDDKPGFTETNHLSLIHTFQSPSFVFKDDIDDDITPTLSFVGPRMQVPLHDNKPLTWNHKLNLIGDKCPSPRIHICEKCERPILLYGRLMPCKHVFCYDCAKASPVCLRCNDKVARVEKNKLGAVFMCSYENCRRTYLSHRDLQAHVSHRHLRRSSNFNLSNQSTLGASVVASLLTVTSPSTSVGSSTTHPFPSRSKNSSLSSNNFTHFSSRATSSIIPMSSIDDALGNDRNHLSYNNNKNKLPNTKNHVMSGKSPSLTSQSLANLPRNNWTTSGQPSSTTSSASSSSFTSPTLPSSLSTSSWNLPLLSDPRQNSAVNRHFYQ